MQRLLQYVGFVPFPDSCPFVAHLAAGASRENCKHMATAKARLAGFILCRADLNLAFVSRMELSWLPELASLPRQRGSRRKHETAFVTRFCHLRFCIWSDPAGIGNARRQAATHRR
jgi:hypothetical protein